MYHERYPGSVCEFLKVRGVQIMNEPTINVNECATNFCRGDAVASVTAASGMKWNNGIRKLAEKFPEEVQIIAVNEDGSIFAHVPSSWVKIQPPRRVEMTDEQKAAVAERFRLAREKLKAEEAEKIDGFMNAPE